MFSSLAATATIWALAPERILAGAEVRIDLPLDASHVRASAGEVIGWDDRVVRWRAPSVCAEVSVDLVAQAANGREETFRLRVSPTDARTAFAILQESADVFEIQAAGPHTLAFGVSAGRVEALPPHGACRRARWSVEPSETPDWMVAATFDDRGPVAWAAAPRIAHAVQVVDATPRSTVVVSIEGRQFRRTVGDEPRVEIPIEIPPAVKRAVISGNGRSVVQDLAPPPPRSRHWLVSPDGGLWLFQIDARGHPQDEPAPAGARPVAHGTYRWRGDAMAASPPPVSRALTSAVARVWRLGGALARGQEVRQGPVAFGGVGAEGAGAGFGGALLFSGLRLAEEGGDGVIFRSALASVLWAELGATLGKAPLRMWAGPGAGGAWVYRRLSPTFDRASWRLEAGLVGTFAVRLGAGPLDLEARLLASTVPVRADDGLLGGWFGASWRGFL